MKGRERVKNKIEGTSNVIIAGNGRERFKIELKFVEKLIF